ncbi:PQQ-dependent sugar dehydrogenase [Gordonia crocea]|uniref:Oxidoreductase n=1 Tax=Gordonia crocea TaxID=589162 RepID=A0A7I9UXH2_9ACTN|nr:PQQ-dependent sugar dehydrogenase [Gordonia crocea]GED97775.1 oxidoreductase [Gordonia crocea]
MGGVSGSSAVLARFGVGLVLVCILVMGGCATDAPPPDVTGQVEPSSPPAAQYRVVAMGLAAPWSIAFAGRTALISERDTARVLELVDGHTRVVGTVPGVHGTGEGGLLGIAVHNRELFAYHTAGTQNRIVAFRLVGAPGHLSLGRMRTVLSGIPAAATHNGGRIAFGPDGMLYATTGDAGRPRSAQDPDSLAGKILRMTPSGEAPADNPFGGSVVYTLGHRNVQGIAWAPDGTMYASEFGADRADELNRIEPGRNYGWPSVEGVGRRDGFTDPLQTWPPEDASPSGIAVVGGEVVIANLRGERLRTVSLTRPRWVAELHAGEFGRLRDVVLAPDGQVWVLTNNTDGRGSPGAGDDRIIGISLG